MFEVHTVMLGVAFIKNITGTNETSSGAIGWRGENILIIACSILLHAQAFQAEVRKCTLI